MDHQMPELNTLVAVRSPSEVGVAVVESVGRSGGAPNFFPVAVANEDLHGYLLLGDQAERDAMPAVAILDEMPFRPDVDPNGIVVDEKALGLDARDERIDSLPTDFQIRH